MTEALGTLHLNALGEKDALSQHKTPLKKIKRKQCEDDSTPRSRHVDKRTSMTEALKEQDIKRPSNGFDAMAIAVVEHDIDKLDIASAKSDKIAVTADHRPYDKALEDDEEDDVFRVCDPTVFHGHSSLGSVMSHPEHLSSEAVSEPDNPSIPEITDLPKESHFQDVVEVDVTRAQLGTSECEMRVANYDPTSISRDPVSSRHSSPCRTTKPAQISVQADLDLVGTDSRGVPGDVIRGTPRFSELDLLSFQTPAPKNTHGNVSSNLRRFTSQNGEELLVDVTPRIYSPRSIPIYTLKDLDRIKAEFDEVRHELELKNQALHQELAQSVSHATHHKALAAQGESLHTEYSKKHVRKVTALKADWERKYTDRIRMKDEALSQKDGLIAELEAALEQERIEKKEVIEMAEAVLKMANES